VESIAIFKVLRILWGISRLLLAWTASADLRLFKTFTNFSWFDRRKIRIIIAETYEESAHYSDETTSGAKAGADGKRWSSRKCLYKAFLGGH
jgi:hypothetical protein